jgi:hypothetical protein
MTTGHKHTQERRSIKKEGTQQKQYTHSSPVVPLPYKCLGTVCTYNRLSPILGYGSKRCVQLIWLQVVLICAATVKRRTVIRFKVITVLEQT